jgi:hypothetical protein
MHRLQLLLGLVCVACALVLAPLLIARFVAEGNADSDPLAVAVLALTEAPVLIGGLIILVRHNTDSYWPLLLLPLLTLCSFAASLVVIFSVGAWPLAGSALLLVATILAGIDAESTRWDTKQVVRAGRQ